MMSLIRAWLFSGSEKASAPPQQDTFLVVVLDRFGTHGLDQLVEVLRVLVGLAVDTERTVGLAADVAGDLDAVQRLVDLLAHLVVAEVLDQDLDHVAIVLVAFSLRPASASASLVSAISLSSSCRRSWVSLVASQQAAQVATMSCPGLCLLGDGDVARRQRQTRQLTAAGIADGGGAAVPVRDLVELDIQRLRTWLSPRPCSWMQTQPSARSNRDRMSRIS